MKRIGFLSFGHWADVPGSQVRTARDSLLQAVELAVAAEEIGVDGAWFRVHHFVPQHSAPFPLLAAVAARTSRIELGTGVVDMRYENPLHMAEEAAAVDLLSGGRLQLGISRGSPEPVHAGYEAFGHVPDEGETDAGMARRHAAVFRDAIAGAGLARTGPGASGRTARVPVQPQSAGLPERIWWGAGTRATARWAAEQGMNLMSSTLLTEDTGVSFDRLQAEQIALYHEAWAGAGHPHAPRVSVSRSIVPLVDDRSRHFFGLRAQAGSADQVGLLDGGPARFGRSYVGEPERLVAELADDAAVAAADTLLLTVPTQLGVDFTVRLLDSVVHDVGPALGWDRD